MSQAHHRRHDGDDSLGSSGGTSTLDGTMQITEPIRLVLTRNRNKELLVVDESGEYRLPRIDIPAGERLAKFITNSLKRMWGLTAICLFGSNTEPSINGLGGPYLLLECRDKHWVPPSGVEWRKREFLLE